MNEGAVLGPEEPLALPRSDLQITGHLTEREDVLDHVSCLGAWSFWDVWLLSH